uniref:Uncharacterized protein n=1 Tax=Timema shepardi TaxID=629360 RepID=A0A7R9G3S7_TIMSH|nr:unnamed protein product [Timema shepardi]
MPGHCVAQVVHVFNSLVNVVQATLNHTHTLLGFVLKQKVNPFLCDGDGARGEEAKVPWLEVYKPYLVALYSQGPRAQQPRDLGLERSHQIMVQFLYRRKDIDYTTHKLLVLVHQEGGYLTFICSILSYSIRFSSPSGVPRDLSNLVEVGVDPSENQVRCKQETGDWSVPKPMSLEQGLTIWLPGGWAGSERVGEDELSRHQHP